MSFSIDPKNGVRIKTARKHAMPIAAFIIALEAVFSLFLYISLAERVFVVEPASATQGVPELISYQGMLTDTSGNPLGGSGAVYCFRYSIWDAVSGGDQLWPSGTPGNSTTTVIDGVFSDELGRVDSLSGLDFESTSTYYLQVQVSTSSLTCASGLETLAPRQQITSDAWSQTAQSVFGSQLKAGGPEGNIVQIGTGLGVSSSSVTLLSLDVDSHGDESIGGSCSANGTLWYDSTLSRTLVCENSKILPISTQLSFAGNGLSGTSTLINPTFVAGANVSFSTNGSTVSIVGGAGGGGGATLSQFDWPTAGSNTTIAMASNGAMTFVPFFANQGVSATKAYALISYSGATTSTASTASQTISIGIGLYTLGGGTSTGTLSTVSSGSSVYVITYSSNASSASLVGIRRISIPITINATPGDYWYGLWARTTTGNALSMSLSFMGAYPFATAYSGNFSSATATSQQYLAGLGIFSASTAALPGSVAINAIQEGGTAVDVKEPYIIFSNY